MFQMNRPEPAGQKQEAKEEGGIRGTLYCMKCKEKKEVTNARKVEVNAKGGNKRPALRAKCPVCGTKMFKFLPKDEK